MRTLVRDSGCILWDIKDVCCKTELFKCCGSSVEIVELNLLGFSEKIDAVLHGFNGILEI